MAVRVPDLSPLRFAVRPLALAGCLGLLACSGTVSEPGAPDREREGEAGDGDLDKGGAGVDVPEGEAFACDESVAPAPAPLRRLSKRQYRNTLSDVVTRLLGDDATASKAVLDGAAAGIAMMPDDVREIVAQDHHGSFRRLDQGLEQKHVDAAFSVARQIAGALTQAPRLAVMVGSCAGDGEASNDEGCLRDFITRAGRLVLRRPLTDAEVDGYRTVYGADARANPAGYADVLAAMLVAPQFVFHVESGGDAVAERPNVYRLTAHELASRLSYQFWDTMPDQALFAAAESGALDTPEGLTAEVDRLLDDPRAAATLSEFFHDWLKLADVPSLYERRDEPLFRAFAGADAPTAELRQQMLDEVLAMLEYHALSDEGTAADLLLDDRVFARGEALARLYGVAPWDGQGEPARFPAGERPGLLTRAAFHVFGSANTRPVMKGVFARKAILCDELPAPPADAMATEPELSNSQSTREVVEAITEQPSSSCVGCHGGILNPIGFATENFDAMGRLRREQRLFDEEGNETGIAAIDTRTVPQIVPGDMTEVDGPQALAALMVKSGKPQACLARQYFRFSFARWDDVEQDGCALERLRRAGSIKEMLREVALVPAFAERVIP